MSQVTDIITLVFAVWILGSIAAYLYGRYLFHDYTIHFLIFTVVFIVILVIVKSVLDPEAPFISTIPWPIELLIFGVGAILYFAFIVIGVKHADKAKCLRDGGKWDNEKGSCKIEE